MTDSARKPVKVLHAEMTEYRSRGQPGKSGLIRIS